MIDMIQSPNGTWIIGWDNIGEEFTHTIIVFLSLVNLTSLWTSKAQFLYVCLQNRMRNCVVSLLLKILKRLLQKWAKE